MSHETPFFFVSPSPSISNESSNGLTLASEAPGDDGTENEPDDLLGGTQEVPDADKADSETPPEDDKADPASDEPEDTDGDTTGDDETLGGDDSATDDETLGGDDETPDEETKKSFEVSEDVLRQKLFSDFRRLSKILKDQDTALDGFVRRAREENKEMEVEVLEQLTAQAAKLKKDIDRVIMGEFETEAYKKLLWLFVFFKSSVQTLNTTLEGLISVLLPAKDKKSK